MKNFLTIFFSFFSFINIASACELCSIFNSVDNQEREKNNLFLGVAFQNQSSSSNARPAILDFLKINQKEQKLESYITQIFANYYLDEKFSLQLNLPFIKRDYTRFDGNSFINDTEEGLGDISLLLKYIPFQKYYGKLNYRTEIFTGIKLPTADTDLLAEVLLDPVDTGLRHGGINGSLIGGDDITLGTGSYDFILGSTFYLQRENALLQGNLQYSIRTEGDYNYQFGNDLQWSLSPGYYVITNHKYTASLRSRFSGEYKSKDKLEGEKQEDSEEFNMFLGPEIIVTYGQNLFLQLALDFPIKNDNSENEINSKKRFITSLTYKF